MTMDYTYVDSNEELHKLRTNILKHIREKDLIALDIETSGLDVHSALPWLCTIKPKGGSIYIIDLQRTDLGLLKDILEGHLLVGANIKFDLKTLRKLGIRPRQVYDVIIAEQVLSVGIRLGGNSLSVIHQRYFGSSLDKVVRSAFVMDPTMTTRIVSGKDPVPSWTDKQLRYAAADVDKLHEIGKRQKIRLKAHKLQKIISIENKLVPIVADMEYDGIKVDEDLWLKLEAQMQEELLHLRKETCDLLGGPGTSQNMFPTNNESRFVINLNSDKEIKKRFRSLGYHLDSANAAVLKRLQHPAAVKLTEYRKAKKRIDAYGKDWIAGVNPVTGRVHSTFHQEGTRSGRYSSSKPNVQQIPAGAYRKAFISEDGNKLVFGDYSQIELRILAEISGDTNMIGIINSGGDIHSQTAALVLGKPLDECGKGTENRKYGKTINFAQIYGQGFEELAKSLEISPEEGKNLQNKYFAQFPEIQKYFRNVVEKTIKQGYSETMLGRKRWFPAPDNAKDIPPDLLYLMQSSGRNHPIQGTSADMLKIAQINLADKVFPDTTLRDRVMQIDVVHDEILCEAHEDIAQQTAKLLEESMVAAGKVFLKKVPIVVEIEVADTWR